MKSLRKIMALLIAMVMVLGMSISVFAEGNYKITVEKNADKDAHTYAAYQIIKGDLDTTEGSATKGQLKNLSWATGVNGANLLTALKADATISSKFADCDETAASVAAAMAACSADTDVEALAAVLGAYVDSAELTEAGTSTNNVIDGLDQGYYFVKDITPDASLRYDTKSQYMLQVVGDVTVKAKDSTVSIEKKVDDKNDSTTAEDGINWQDTADYDVNDVIPYRLKGTLPSNYDKFDFFNYAFTDTMSNGLTLNADSVKVVYYANAAALEADTTATGGEIITSNFTITSTKNADGTTLSVKVESAFDNDGKVTDAGLKKINGLTKDSIIVVYYNATLNENAVIGSVGNANTAKLTYSNNPNATGSGDNTTSDTPDDTNIVFTYKVDVNKVDENEKPLAGATFALYKEVTDTTAQTGEAIKTALGNSVKADALDDAKHYITVGTIAATKDGDNYTAKFERIDDGNYVLVETVVPSGYNSWESQAFTVTASHTNDPAELKLDALTGDLEKGTVDKAAGSITASIQNNSGSTLPSTGGMGTTLFYIVGGILVAGAAIILIAKRKVNA